eukprot:12918631-Prorocentrum_lima.AAC.1
MDIRFYRPCFPFVRSSFFCFSNELAQNSSSPPGTPNCGGLCLSNMATLEPLCLPQATTTL